MRLKLKDLYISLEQSQKLAADHLEFGFEVRGEDTFADACVNVRQIPPASLVDFVQIGMQFIRANDGKDVHHLPFDLRFEFVGLDVDWIEFREAKLLICFTVNSLDD